MQSISRSALPMSRSTALKRVTNNTTNTVRSKSTATTNSNSNTLLEGDAGSIGTHLHHKMTTFLAVATPIYFLAPDSLLSSAGSLPDKVLGVAIAVNVSAHSWVGLNYVVTDYVPKISKNLLAPARIFTAALSAVTLLGLSMVSFNGKGGLKGTVMGLWTSSAKPTATKDNKNKVADADKK